VQRTDLRNLFAKPKPPDLVDHKMKCSIPLSAEFLTRGAEERATRDELRRAHLRVSLNTMKTWMAENKVERTELRAFLTPAQLLEPPQPLHSALPPEPPAPPETSDLRAVCSVPLSAEFLARGAEERAAREELRRAHPRVSLNSVKAWMAENKVEGTELHAFLTPAPQPAQPAQPSASDPPHNPPTRERSAVCH
jgi:hypothetical protein